MQKLSILLVLAALAAAASSEAYYNPEEAYDVYSSPQIVYKLHRPIRSTEDENKGDDGKWIFNPNLARDEDGNTKGTVTVKRKGENSEVETGYGRVVDGPNKGKDTWWVGGTINWD